MKISMWMIAERLRDCAPNCDIKRGEPCIEGIRFLSDPGSGAYEERFVYLCTELSNIMLVNGEDMILIQGQDTEIVLNRLLDIFEFYNRWEAALWELSVRSSLQAVLDRGGEALQNPMILSALDGSVLAMSSQYRDMDLNENWVYCREKGFIPTSILGTPVRSEDNRAAEWLEKPQVLLLPQNIRTIGALLYADEKPVAAISLWEMDVAIHPGHVHLMKLLCDVLGSMLRKGEESTSLRNEVSILTDLLNGVRIDTGLLQRLELRCHKPWVLLTVSSPYSVNPVSRQSLVRQMVGAPEACIPMLYGEEVVCLLSEGQGEVLIKRLFGRRELELYSVILSMPFDDLEYLSTRYRQNRYCLERRGNRSGSCRSEEQGLAFALNTLRKHAVPEALVHPALAALRKYDREHDGDMYASLYYYLYYERSLQKAADAVHVHRNSFLYRIRRIQTLLKLDLDDPEVRAYLLFSYRVLNFSSAKA